MSAVHIRIDNKYCIKVGTGVGNKNPEIKKHLENLLSA
jgi:hypothetical protein